MPEFRYIARTASGQQTSGMLAAGSAREVVAQLASRSLFPVEIAQDEATRRPRRGGRVGMQLLATTYGQLAALLRSGVPLLRSLQVLRKQTSNARLATVLQDIHDRVEGGASLADAMARHPDMFRDVAVNMIRAGGEGGFLEEALDRVAQFTEHQQDLQSRTLGAIAYPIFLAVVGFFVVCGLLLFVVPRCAEMFERLRQQGELPWLTDALLWVSDQVKHWGLYVSAALAVGLVALRGKMQSDAGRYWIDRMKLRVPLIGKVFESLAVARFCRVLGTLLHNGVPILKALQISRDSTGNRVLSAAIAQASENVTAGQRLATPLEASGHFPQETIEMISVAEEANALERVLVDIADNLERRTSRRLDLLVRLLEPVMLLVLAIFVLLIVMALLLPILKMSTTM